MNADDKRKLLANLEEKEKAFAEDDRLNKKIRSIQEKQEERTPKGKAKKLLKNLFSKI